MMTINAKVSERDSAPAVEPCCVLWAAWLLRFKPAAALRTPSTCGRCALPPGMAGTLRSLVSLTHFAARSPAQLLARPALAHLVGRSGSMQSAADRSPAPASGGGKAAAAVQLQASTSGGGSADAAPGPVLIQPGMEPNPLCATLPVFDLSAFLGAPDKGSPEVQRLCAALAACLQQSSALVVRDPRVRLALGALRRAQPACSLCYWGAVNVLAGGGGCHPRLHCRCRCCCGSCCRCCVPCSRPFGPEHLPPANLPSPPHPQVDTSQNSVFLDTMEAYFSQPVGALMADVRPQLAYQVGGPCWDPDLGGADVGGCLGVGLMWVGSASLDAICFPLNLVVHPSPAPSSPAPGGRHP